MSFSAGSIQVRASSDGVISPSTPLGSMILPYDVADMNLSIIQRRNVFVGGEVDYIIDGIGQPGANVSLFRVDQLVDEVTIDDYGGFQLRRPVETTVYQYSITMSDGTNTSDQDLPLVIFPQASYGGNVDGTNLTIEVGRLTNPVMYSLNGGQNWDELVTSVPVPEGTYSTGSIMVRGSIVKEDGSIIPGPIESLSSVMSPFQPVGTNISNSGTDIIITGLIMPTTLISLIRNMDSRDEVGDALSDPYGFFTLEFASDLVEPGVTYHLYMLTTARASFFPVQF